MSVQIIFETHSTTEDNEAGIATGWLPGRLSERGREEAAALGTRRSCTGIDAVFVSDLQRAVETARIAFETCGIPIHQDARLRECNYGDLNGCQVALLTSERRKRIDEPFPSGQSYRQVLNAMHAFLRDLAREWDGRRVLIIGHSATRWSLQCLLGGAALENLVDAPFDWQPGWTFTLADGDV